MIEMLLPPSVVAVEAFGDLPPLFDFAMEQRLVAGAVEKRRREFMTARRCAHEALRRLGIPPAPIGSGADHAPVWPAGLVGSITHCDGYRAAAVARCGEIASVGIDAEVNQPLPTGVGDAVLRRGEHPPPDYALPSDHRLHGDRLLFSCKEAAYKAWYPLTGHWLDFTDLEVVVDPVHHRFSARVHVDDPPAGTAPHRPPLHGRYTGNEQLIVTAVTVSAEKQPTDGPRQ